VLFYFQSSCFILLVCLFFYVSVYFHKDVTCENNTPSIFVLLFCIYFCASVEFSTNMLYVVIMVGKNNNLLILVLFFWSLCVCVCVCVCVLICLYKCWILHGEVTIGNKKLVDSCFLVLFFKCLLLFCEHFCFCKCSSPQLTMKL
jgi:hypothetical protein